MLRVITLSLIINMFCQIALAESIILTDKSQIDGRILSFYDDKFVISIGEEKQIIEKSKVAKILFDNKEIKTSKRKVFKPDRRFASPIKTFLYWKRSAIKGDLEDMASCFMAVSRDDQLAQLKNFSKKQIKKMRKETKKTYFSFTKPLIDGNSAYLSVTRTYKGDTSKSIIQFIKEGSNWKMIPE